MNQILKFQTQVILDCDHLTHISCDTVELTQVTLKGLKIYVNTYFKSRNPFCKETRPRQQPHKVMTADTQSNKLGFDKHGHH